MHYFNFCRVRHPRQCVCRFYTYACLKWLGLCQCYSHQTNALLRREATKNGYTRNSSRDDACPTLTSTDIIPCQLVDYGSSFFVMFLLPTQPPMQWEAGRRVIIQTFVWRDGENPRKTSVRRVDIPDEIRTEHLRNTSLETYCYTSILSLLLLKATGLSTS